MYYVFIYIYIYSVDSTRDHIYIILFKSVLFYDLKICVAVKLSHSVFFLHSQITFIIFSFEINYNFRKKKVF